MIFAATSAVAWWSWETLQDRRLELGAEAQPLHDGSDRRLLTTDLVEREAAGTRPRTSEPHSLSADLERSARPVRAVDAANITVDGRVAAGLVISAALGAATAASAWVVRRYPRRSPLVASVTREGWFDEQEVAEAGVDGEAESLGTVVGDPLEPAEADVTGQFAAEPAVQDGQVAEQTSLPTALVAQRQPDGDEGVPGSVSRVVPLDSGGWPVSADAAEPPPQSSTFSTTSDVAARQRLYDRRMSRSVPYVHPAWLWWAEENAPATVQELGLVGLRCMLAVPLDVGPALGAEARMFFPLNGSTMKVNARVSWKEHTADGMEVGLEFVGLTHDDSAALERLLVSMA